MIKVSIPYSTIKRVIGDFNDTLKDVSIPYSTIKSPVTKEQSEKGYKVSIPYSTIKREEFYKIYPCKMTFQFLIVQLKGRAPILYGTFVKVFQFLIVQLKV